MQLRKLLFAGILLPFLGLVSCGGPEPVKRVSEGAYFDVPGFMQQQLALLNRKKPDLLKTVWVNGQKPETKQLQNVNWAEELQHFLEIDLNKKALAGAYSASEKNIPAGKRILYLRKPEVSTPIKSVEIITDHANNVKQLHAVSDEKNALFYNREERTLIMGSNKMIKEYQISGVQKVLFFDSLHYAAKAGVSGI